ncbi:MAG TPA: hypothetical protein VNI54_09445 [Thermoanaerobaculia bacterium]|nr:hypothetical protein [Thermoanaerobaculia bacterium]
MIVRTFLFALCTLVALDTAAAVRLVAGEELSLSTLMRGIPRASRPAPAMATDGDTILAVHANGGAIFATRFDRDGKLLTPEPLPILQRTDTDGMTTTDSPMRLLWFRDHYLLFFRAIDGSVRAIRITATGIPVETVTLSLKPVLQFDVATNGNELVVVSEDSKALRLDATLQLAGTITLAPSRFTWPSGTRSVAFGDGRFVIVTLDYGKVVAEIVQNGTASAPVELGPAHRDAGAFSKVLWTGSTFVAGWSECSRDDYFDYCLGVWTPLTTAGAPDGPLRITGYAPFYFTDASDFDFDITALDRDTVFCTWRGSDEKVMFGRKYGISGGATESASTLGKEAVTPFVTSRGALALLDARQRLAWVEAPASAPLPAAVSFEPTVLTPPNEQVYGVAASATEIGVLRVSQHEDVTASVAVSFLARDGWLLRELELPRSRVADAAITSDGRDFFVLTWHWYAETILHNLSTGKKTVIRPPGPLGSMVWTGTELVTSWLGGGTITVAAYDRNGAPVGPPATLAPADAEMDLTVRDGRVLLAYHEERQTFVQVFDSHGQPIGAAEKVEDTNPWWHGAIGTNGQTDVLVTMKAELYDMRVAFRPRNGTFVTPPGRLTGNRNGTEPAVASTAHGFAVAYQVNNTMLRTTHLALIDDQGYATRNLGLGTGASGRQFLVELAPNQLLHVYSRFIDDSRRAGALRAYGRMITLTNEDSARSDDAQGPRSARRQ